MSTLAFWTLTAHLTAIVVDRVDLDIDPDIQPVSCTVDIIPRLPPDKIIWASGLVPKQGLALAPMRARFDTDGYLRTVVAQAHNETQTITTTLTSGTFTLTFNGQTTTAIPYNAPSLTVQNALAALSNIGVGNISVGGATGGPWKAAFTGIYAATDVPLMTATPSTTVATTALGSLNAGVKLVANTDAINIDQLVYDLVFSNVVYNRSDQQIPPMAFVAPNQGGITLDMADLEWVQPKAGIG